MSRNHSIAAVLAASIVLGGCATVRMHLRYGTLTSQTEMRESIFLELRSELPPTVYIAETCSADSDITVRPGLDGELAASGYTLVEDPDQATYVIQINHLRLTEAELSKDQTLGDAIGAAFAAGTAAGLAADVVGAGAEAAVGVGLAVGAAGFILDASTKHIAHMLTTDVLVTETVAVRDSLGDPGDLEPEVVTGGRPLRRHGTQIVSGASKVNLRLTESLPVLVDGMGHTLARLLPPRPARDD